MGRSRWSWIGAALGLTILLTWLPMARGEAPGLTFSFGVVPQQSASEVTRLWTPILAYLSKKSGVPLQLETAKDIDTFQQRVMTGGYDFAYVNSAIYVRARQVQAYEAFAKEKDRSMTGILVVRKESRWQSLAELAGADLAFPGEAAAAASVLPRAHLDKQRIPFTPHYVNSHDSVYLGVAKGLYVAGGGASRTLDMLQPAVREQLRVLWTSPAYSPHPFIVRRDLPASIVARVKAAMLAAEADPAGQAALKSVAFKGITSARDADYDDMRALLGLAHADNRAR